MKIFDAEISPILEYCSEIWYTNKFCEELEKIHLAYMKDILKGELTEFCMFILKVELDVK